MVFENRNMNDNSEQNRINLINHCNYYIVRKQRYCKMKPLTCRRFCPEHSFLDPELQSCKFTERMPCPLDQKHTCFVRKLEEHLKKCNAKEKEKPIYYQKNVNSEVTNESKEKITLADISNEELLKLINKIRKTYANFVPELQIEEESHPVLQTALNDPANGQVAMKHLRQQVSLLGHMKNKNLLSNETCFVEFGAGRGQLTSWIIKTVNDKESCKFLLVDKASQRHKYDNKLRYEKGLHIERIRLDIEHLCLDKIQSIASHKGKLVGVSKHLCGAATDLALRCLIKTLNERNSEEIHNILHGLVMATCCHHQCSWQTYVGQSFLKEQGYSCKDFQLLCGIASWATCGRMPKHSDNENTKSFTEDLDKNRYRKLNLSAEQREEIGRQCKRVLDYGRVTFLQKNNFNAILTLYVEPSVSLENVALIAFERQQ